MDLSKLESACAVNSKPKITAHQLTLNQHYKIVRIRSAKTKYGRAIIVELEENIMFLPKRFESVFETEDKISDFNRNHINNYSLVVEGFMKTAHNLETPLIQFIEKNKK